MTIQGELGDRGLSGRKGEAGIRVSCFAKFMFFDNKKTCQIALCFLLHQGSELFSIHKFFLLKSENSFIAIQRIAKLKNTA